MIRNKAWWDSSFQYHWISLLENFYHLEVVKDVCNHWQLDAQEIIHYFTMFTSLQIGCWGRGLKAHSTLSKCNEWWWGFAEVTIVYIKQSWPQGGKVVRRNCQFYKFVQMVRTMDLPKSVLLSHGRSDLLKLLLCFCFLFRRAIHTIRRCWRWRPRRKQRCFHLCFTSHYLIQCHCCCTDASQSVTS